MCRLLNDECAYRNTSIEYLRADLVEGLVDAAKEALVKPQEIHEIMRREGLKIDNHDDPMQKLAFTIYTKLVSVVSGLEHALAAMEEEAL
jgi:hypothetical protein